MKLKAICNAEDRIECFIAFCSLSYVRAAMQRITSLELLGTLIAGLEKKSKLIDFKPTFAENLFSVSESLINESERSLLIFHEIKGYLQCRRQILMSYSFLAVSVMLELQCTESLVQKF